MFQSEIYGSGQKMSSPFALRLKKSFVKEDSLENEAVNLYPEIQYQKILGFGGAFTESAAYNYSLLNDVQRQLFLKSYFQRGNGLGYNFCRIPINSCDFSLSPYTYVEENDTELQTFSLRHDEKYLIPMLKAAVKESDGHLSFFASPWSPPGWMKNNGSVFQGGKLLPQYADLWGEYFARFIEGYRKKGIQIVAVTAQNEPKAAQTWESCQYTAKEEADFIVRHLKPALERHGLGNVGILLWDHNKERMFERACGSFQTEGARQAVWGIGFHWYSGSHFQSLDLAAQAFPEKKLIATEFCLGGKQDLTVTAEDALLYSQEISGDLNHGASAVVDWNLILDEKGGPYHNRSFGCKAPVVYQSESKSVKYTPVFTAIGHFSRLIEKGAIRIANSTYSPSLLCTSVQNPDKSIIAVLTNKMISSQNIIIRISGQSLPVAIGGKSMLTLKITD